MGKEIVNVDFEFSVTQMGGAFPGITSGGKNDVTITESAKVCSPKNKKVLEKEIKEPTPDAWSSWGSFE